MLSEHGQDSVVFKGLHLLLLAIQNEYSPFIRSLIVGSSTLDIGNKNCLKVSLEQGLGCGWHDPEMALARWFSPQTKRSEGRRSQ